MNQQIKFLMQQTNLSSFHQRLMKWFYQNARNLPWRHTKDPYKIWISEIMLQQTQVDTVRPYYEKWLKHFPTLQSLAQAPLANVLKCWAGLGYYRRARMLYKSARLIREHYSGEIPQQAKTLQKLPGIGRYTAGAIASIAFGQRAPVLDGNVIRVLSRLKTYAHPVDQSKNREELWRFADSILPREKVGDFNQALMELGALICLPANPKCFQCPVSFCCKAYEKNCQAAYPLKLKREKIQKKRFVALIVKRNGQILLEKQPPEGRWGGLWTFPFWKSKKAMMKDLNLSQIKLNYCRPIHYGFTRYLIRLNVYENKTANLQSKIKKNIQNNSVQNRSLAWLNTQKLDSLPFPSPHQQIANRLLK